MNFQDKVKRPRNTKVLHRIDANNASQTTLKTVTLTLNDDGMSRSRTMTDVHHNHYDAMTAAAAAMVAPPAAVAMGHGGGVMKHSVSSPLLHGAWSGRRLENAIEPHVIDHLAATAGACC